MKTNHDQCQKSPLLASRLLLVINFAIIILGQSCQEKPKDQLSEIRLPLPSGSCAATWADSTALDFVNQLELATGEAHPVWSNYRLGDGAVVLHAGKSTDSTECLGLWKGGKVIDYLNTSETPRLATPLYGYYLNFEDQKEGFESPLTKVTQQPNSINQWLEEKDIESAVLMPVDFPNFPFKIPALKKMQIAIHEAFHVEVTLRHWYTGNGPWPVWDKQPDRKGLQNCYNASTELQEAFEHERNELIKLIEALLDKDKPAARKAGNEFIRLRTERYASLKDVRIKRQDDTECDCAEAENIMELEEGLADYASWTMLYDIGLASREGLIQRYRALQKEPFYLTGAILMHAVSLMNDGNVNGIIEQIATSANHDSGAPMPIFEKEFKKFSQGG